jgi:hypothetical protein
MKASILIIALLFAINLQSQSQLLQKKNDSTWCIVTVQQGQGGAYTLVYSPETDSTKAIESYMRIMAEKKYIIDSGLLVKEYNAYDAHLNKITGKPYQVIQGEKIKGALAGNWNIITGSDTLEVKISPQLKVTGGTIKGSLEIIDGNTIKLTQVVAEKGKFEPVILRGERNQIAGKTASGTIVRMVRV